MFLCCMHGNLLSFFIFLFLQIMKTKARAKVVFLFAVLFSFQYFSYLGKNCRTTAVFAARTLIYVNRAMVVMLHLEFSLFWCRKKISFVDNS